MAVRSAQVIVILVVISVSAAQNFQRCCSQRACAWTTWSRWSSCEGICDQGGTQTRSREGTTECLALRCRAPCRGTDTQTRSCDNICQHCFTCGWSQWQPWSTCDQQCGKRGMQTRKRGTTGICQNGDPPCYGDATERRECMRQCDCCPMSSCTWGNWQPWTRCKQRYCDEPGHKLRQRGVSLGCSVCPVAKPCRGQQDESRPCRGWCHRPLFCLCSTWGTWSPCQGQCQGSLLAEVDGVYTRVRKVTNGCDSSRPWPCNGRRRENLRCSKNCRGERRF